jgi:hypothetical protein
MIAAQLEVSKWRAKDGLLFETAASGDVPQLYR